MGNIITMNQKKMVTMASFSHNTEQEALVGSAGGMRDRRSTL